MGISEVLGLLCGLALFLYGMDVMGDALKKSAGTGLKALLGKMTTNPVKGFLLGLGVTLIIQSSSATTVMVVGFVNSGTMTLLQSVGVIIGANVGTAITAWLTALNSLGGESGADIVGVLSIFKPDSWVPIVAVIGICLIMFVKRGKRKYLGVVLIGFAILMTGMTMMSDAVAPLKNDAGFKSLLTMFSNPILGILAGVILTVIIQSSSASIGILQALTVTGAITYTSAIPIIMGQNIGTCVTAMISSLGANKNGKRAAVIHLSFNVIGVVIVSILFYTIDAIAGHIGALDSSINAWGVAAVHTIFKLICVVLIGPFYKQLEKLSHLVIRDKENEGEKVTILDERLFETPSVAVKSASDATAEMARVACNALKDSLSLIESYDAKKAEYIRTMESKADEYEDQIGSYLVKLSAHDMADADSNQITKLLHIIGDFERISDHAVNIVESAEEMKDKKVVFSQTAINDIKVMRRAVCDIVDMTYTAFVNNDLQIAKNIEPLEEVVDLLRDKIKRGHILRLQKSECDIEHGFVLSDILNNFERVSDHCSNVASCVVEISEYDALNMHGYTDQVKSNTEAFDQKVREYASQYVLSRANEE